MKTTTEQRALWTKAGDSDKQDLCDDVEELRVAVQEAAADLVRVAELTESGDGREWRDTALLARHGYDKLKSITGAGVPHTEIIGGASTMKQLERDLRVCVLALRRIERIEHAAGHSNGEVDCIAHNALDEINDDRGASEK
jgi:hypothetical protein